MFSNSLLTLPSEMITDMRIILARLSKHKLETKDRLIDACGLPAPAWRRRYAEILCCATFYTTPAFAAILGLMAHSAESSTDTLS